MRRFPRFLPVLVLPLHASAAPLSGVTAIASSSDLDGRPPLHAVDGTGLNSPADPDDPALWRHQGGENQFGQNWCWLADARSPLPGVGDHWIAFDLGSVVELASMNVFNFGVSTGANNNRGVDQADIYYRSDSFGGNSDNNYTAFDSSGWTLLGSRNFTLGPTNGALQAPDNISLAGINARYIAIDVNSTHGSGSFAGLGEVQFFPKRADPILKVDVASPDPDFAFGTIVGTTATRTVTFVNDSASGNETITFDGASAGGVFSGLAVTYDPGNTGNPPLLEDGDRVSIEITAASGTGGVFAGTLTINTTSTGSEGPDFNDRMLPLSVEFYQIPPAVFGSADLNGNGIPDLAELRFPGLSSLPPGTDSDGDGATNLEEAFAGTDPFDRASVLRGLGFVESAPDFFEFSFTSEVGKSYMLEAGDDLADWSPFGSALTATGPVTTAVIPRGDLPAGGRAFVRAALLPAPDTDLDGLEDELEAYLGWNAGDAASVRSASDDGDLLQFATLMKGGSPHGGMFGSTLPGVPSEEQASRFLAQATFGPTPQKIAALRALGPNCYETWIDQQLAAPPNYLRTYIDVLAARMVADSNAPDYDVFPHYVTEQSNFAMYRENVNTVWMRQALFADDELRQRVAWALSQIVVIGPRCNSYGIAAADWYDTVLEHSLGNYRDLLYDIAVHPWMGWWLSHLGNQKADPTINRMPDENFAREIMQLFSIGLLELNMDGTPVLDVHGNPVETYTNDDIQQVARVFTGLDLQTGIGGQAAFAAAPMRMIESRHDTGDAVSASVYGAPEKVFLGTSLPAFDDDPGRTGLDDVSDTVDILINHPNCPPFISMNLIQHLVTSNPSPAYVERVAGVFADDGTGVRGNLAATVKAILMDPEARDLAAALDPRAGRLKGPMLRTVAMARAFDAGAATPALHDLTGIQFWAPRKQDVFSDFLEYPNESPSVFNFYEPGYSRPGEVRDLGLLSPEFQIMNALTATSLPNRMWSFIQGGFHYGNPAVTPEFRLQLGPVRSLSVDTDALLDHLNLIFCHGTMSPAGRAEMKAAIDFYAATDPNWIERSELAVFLALISPDGSVLK
ncbi:MAG: DUF1800 family protein [Akkermansiaceae bacterium]|nr:DUF1800 family protein [Akkermansiaceae bacterium]NNM28076.1 DUF1800 family protein [Akkermansiaceae bacterium]